MRVERFTQGAYVVGWAKRSVPTYWALRKSFGVLAGVMLAAGAMHSACAQGIDPNAISKGVTRCQQIILSIVEAYMRNTISTNTVGLDEFEIKTTFDEEEDLTAGLTLYFAWRVTAEITPHPTWGFKIFFPVKCLADLDTRRITTVDFFVAAADPDLDPNAIESVLDRLAAEWIGTDEDIAF